MSSQKLWIDFQLCNRHRDICGRFRQYSAGAMCLKMRNLARSACMVFVVLVAAPTAWAKSIVTSAVDDREHRYMVLENGLQVLLIHDAKADKAAAALDVYTGSADNPADRAGLAHFLEHMLFLGTEKYPDPDEYQAFISANGGGHNAYTAIDNTNYFFDVRADALEPALDRFAQFFVAPLFTPEYVTRERNAVHSEYSARIKDDMRRSFDALREIVNPAHPAAQFSVGSLETLADRDQDAVRDDLLDFYRTHYSSDNMALVVLGKESLDELEAMVKPRFSQVPKRQLQVPRAAQPLFKPGRLPLQLSVKPVKELRSLSLIFPVPLLQPHYRQKPVEYIANLLGHEGEGSVLAVLKEKGWAESLSAGSGFDDRYSSSVMINIRLTQAGWQHYQEVVGLFFEGVKKLTQKGVKGWRYREQSQLAELSFQYQEKQDPQRTVSFLASQLQQYPSAEVYQAGYIYEDFDKSLIKQYLAKLTPDNLLLIATAPEVKTNKVSQYYQTPYQVASLEEVSWSVPDNLVNQLSLPGRNEFVPKKLRLLSGDAAAADAKPQQQTYQDTDLWFQLDTSYGVPKGTVLIRTLLPSVTENVTQAAQLALYVRMVEESLNAFTYPATLAGLHFSLSANTRGLDIQLGGYSEKQTLLLKKIVAQLNDFDALQPEFERIKAQVMRGWRNAQKRPPYNQLFSELSVVMFAPQWSRDQKLAALEQVSVADMKAFVENLFEGGTARVLVYGNFQASDGQEVATVIEQLLTPQTQNRLAKAQVVKLDNAADWRWLTVDHPDQALVGYLQGRDDSLAEQARTMLLQQVLSADFFNQLRTQQQLGYIVFATPVAYKNVPGTAFVVQSPQASIVDIHTSMATFLAQFKIGSEQDLEQHKQALLVDLLQEPKNLSEQAGLYWDDILKEHWDFDRRDAMVKAISAITLAEFKAYYQDAVVDNPRWFWLAAGESDDRPDLDAWVSDLVEFKSSAEVYSYP